jgi:hypothetical protein
MRFGNWTISSWIGLLPASRHELQRRGRPMTPAPISPGEPTSKPSIAKDPLPERQQLPEPKGTLTQGQVKAVLATFKAGIAPSRIARQFGISQSDVRKCWRQNLDGLEKADNLVPRG